MRPFLRFANLFRRRRAEGEMSREIAAHLTLLQEDFERRGMSPEEAALAARRAFRGQVGGIEQVKELHRETRSFAWIEQFFKDVRYGWANLRRNPGFTLTAVIALALGIGVNATIFGLYNAVALKQLPIADAGQVVRLERWTGREAYSYTHNFAYTEYQYLRDHTRMFSDVIASSSAIPVAASPTDGGFEHVNGYAVSANYFVALGLKAHIGRTFQADEDNAAGANAVAVLDYHFWQRDFRGDTNVIGQTIKLNGVNYSIIGVAPPDFFGIDVNPVETAFWTPLSMIERLQPDFGAGWREQWRDKSHPGFQVLGRMKSGITRASAQAEADTLIRGYLAGYREAQPTTAITLDRTAYFGVAGDFYFRLIAGAVWMIVSLVLFVACANVANMLLARGAARQGEIGIRMALGANRGRIIRQLLTESILLSFLGGAAGILISTWTGKLAWASAVGVLENLRNRPVDLDFSPDVHLLIYGLVLSVLTGIVFGLAPALQLTRPRLNLAAMGRSRLRGILLGAQVTVSVSLLIVSGWLLGALVSSFAKDADLGFNSIDTFSVGPVGSKQAQVRERLESRPEVSQVSAGWPQPLQGVLQVSMTAGRWRGDTPVTLASDGYFETLGIRLLRGRGFTRQEANAGAPVAVISAAAARRCWPGEDPLGRHLAFDPRGKILKTPDYEVIGVAKDVRFAMLTQDDPLRVYVPTGAQAANLQRILSSLVIRIQGNPDRAVAAVESEVESVDPSLLPNLNIASIGHGQLALQRGVFRIAGIFAGVLTLLSLTLAGIGIYGVMAFLVSQRTKEIGVRVALGASPGIITRSVVMQGLTPVLIGIACGLAASSALLAIPMVRELVQFSNATNVFSATFGHPVFYAELILVVGIAVLASAIPARRALRVDPAVALRHE